MERMTASTLSEPQIIDHIKFITQGLFSDSHSLQSNYLSPSLRPFTSDSLKKAYYSKQDHHQHIRDCQCYCQLKSQLKQTQTTPSKSKSRKPPIFEQFKHFWSAQQRRSPGSHTPVIDRINQNIYGKLLVQNKEMKEWKFKHNKGEIQQMWKQFLTRENKWIEDKRYAIRQAEIYDRTRLLSFSPQTNLQSTLSPDRSRLRQESDVLEGISELKRQTEKLKQKILSYQNFEHGKSPLRKTFHVSGK